MSRAEICAMLPDQCLSVFASTWNLGGRSPVSDLALDKWIHAHHERSSGTIDMYILSLQEVPGWDMSV